jgi:tRNA-splicing ligase RtcB (3'-phosphate/5'-hydroxy nucleic acid ligase)
MLGMTTMTPSLPLASNPEMATPAARAPVHTWTEGVPFEPEARAQIENLARVPVVAHVAVMPDVHTGKGSTIGSVIATRGAIIPAAVGVDLGCGMMAVRTSLRAEDLPSNLRPMRAAIEKRVPHGRSGNGGKNDRGAWSNLPPGVAEAWATLEPGYRQLVARCPRLGVGNDANHLGTLGTGNHFVEVCLDEASRVWVMLHSGSRGVGNRIGSTYIERAKMDMLREDRQAPLDANLSYVVEGSEVFDDYVRAVGWAQRFALVNRELMMAAALEAIAATPQVPPFTSGEVAVNCHHNYVVSERHFGEDVWVTRKGAVRAGVGELGIIPGSMGARSFIVRGKGEPRALCSCSHGAGRAMSRTAAKKRFSLEEHARATEGIECRKDAGVIDETPSAYKSIEAVMAAQKELVDVVHELRQVVCVKG